MIAKKFKVISLALIFSGALNVALVAVFVYWMVEKTESAPPLKKEVVTTNSQIFQSMKGLKFRELVSFLTNRERLEEGYTKRDLAVASLVSYHHFNLEKALSAPPSQVRTLLLGKGETINVFPGLTEEQFEAIIRFAYQEKWPLTPKGLFAHLQKQRDESLEQAFFLTPEFHAIQVLFQKTGCPQDSRVLLNLILSGTFEVLERFTEFSEEKRRGLLLNYLNHRSAIAAQLLIKTDFQFALKRLDDRQVIDLVGLLKDYSEDGSRFCLELLSSLRSDAVLETAALALYAYAKEVPSLPIDPQIALSRFTLREKPVAAPVVTPSPSRFHVVKEGESLWKISRQYQVKVEEIVAINGLENNSLYPGMTLKLPAQGTGSEPPR